MQPVHEGLEYEGLFNANAMQSVSICLDSGKIATEHCGNDCRGINRVVNVMCYAEDIPEGYCDKHVPVHYCFDGGGVAGEYCSLFPDAELGTATLVKLTQDEIREIRDARGSGLVDSYTVDSYVYFVDENGEGLPWHGFGGNINEDVSIPYTVCSAHNARTWEEYKESAGLDGDFGNGGNADPWDEDETSQGGGHGGNHGGGWNDSGTNADPW